MSIWTLFDQLSANPVGIETPKALAGETATLFSALFDLNRTERLSIDEFARLRDAQLERLVRHASAQVPYYAERLRAAGYRAGRTPASSIWSAIPVLSRSDLREAGERLRAKSYPKSHGALREWSTSGSSSRPVRIVTTELTAFHWTCLNMRDRMWHDVDLGGTLAVLTDGARKLAGRAVAEHGSWSIDPSSLKQAGKHFKINPTLEIGEQVRTIRRLKPVYIHTRPSQLNLIVKQCEISGERFENLRAVFCVSEVVPRMLRENCADILGVPIIECYSCAELGYIALQCPEEGRLHVQSEMVHLEVLRSDNSPCAPGETGRVVVTALHNYAMPLIRYEIGDEAEMGGLCSCGRTLPVIARVLGRTQDYLKLRSGELTRANTHHSDIAKLPAVIEFQIIQQTTDRLEIKLVVRQPLSDPELQYLKSCVAQQGRETFEVDVTYCKSIDRLESGKMLSFICNIQ